MGQTLGDREEEKRRTLNKIIFFRETGEESLEIINPLSRSTPKLNFEAISVKDLVNWDTETVLEPPLTCHYSNAQLRHFYASPMEAPSWFTHSQDVERIVKMVTDACGKVYGEGMIKSQQVSRELVSK